MPDPTQPTLTSHPSSWSSPDRDTGKTPEITQKGRPRPSSKQVTDHSSPVRSCPCLASPIPSPALELQERHCPTISASHCPSLNCLKLPQTWFMTLSLKVIPFVFTSNSAISLFFAPSKRAWELWLQKSCWLRDLQALAPKTSLKS